jgi:hypothetical protein
MSYTPTQASMADYDAGKTLTEEIELHLYGANRAAVDAAKTSILRLLHRAQTRAKNQAGARIYLEWRPMNEATYLRSEIFDGALLPDKDTFRAWGNNILPVRLIVERNPFWEGAEQEIPMSTAANMTDGVGGRNITLTTLPYANIQSTSIGGDVPAPVRMEITNTAGTLSSRNFYFSNNAEGAPANMTHLINSAVGGVSLINIWQTVEAFTLGATAVESAAGRRFRLLATTAANTTTSAFFRASIQSGGGEVWRPSVSVQGGSSRLLDLGGTPLPPGGGTSSNAALSIIVQGFGSGSVDLNELFILPTDAFSRISQMGGVVAVGGVLNFDWIEDRAWLLQSSQRSFVFGSFAGKLNVFPGRNQRLIILVDTQTGTLPTNIVTVRAWYRPRRLSA